MPPHASLVVPQLSSLALAYPYLGILLSDGHLRTVQASEGNAWLYKTHSRFGPHLHAPVIHPLALTAEGRIYVAAPNGLLFASEDRDVLWQERFSFPLNTPPAADQSGVYLAAQGVHAFSTDGQKRWFHPAPGVYQAPTLLPRSVLVTTVEGRSCALDKTSGTVRWCHLTGLPAAAPLVDGDRIVVVNESGRLTGLRADGKLFLSTRLNRSVRASPVRRGPQQYLIGTRTGDLVLIQAGQAPRTIVSDLGDISSLALDRLSNVYIGTRDGRLHAIRLPNAHRWTLSLGAAVRSPIVCSGHRELLVATDGGVFSVTP